MTFQVSDFNPFKLLLKQVYSLHTSKVKELENEIKLLREQLNERAKVSDSTPDCKRCAELEAAFKSCKKALQEQAKLFETFGQKFSIFNGTDPGTQEFRISPKLKKEEAVSSDETSTKFLASAKNVSDNSKKGSPILIKEENLADQAPVKIMIHGNDLLKKFMFEDGGLNTFDICMNSLPENHDKEHSNKKCDNTIYVPDSLEVENEVKKNNNGLSIKCATAGDKNKVLSSDSEKTKTSNSATNTLPAKRLSSESLEDNRQVKHSKNSSSRDLEFTLVPDNHTLESDTKCNKNLTSKNVSPISLHERKTMHDKGKGDKIVENTKSVLSKLEPFFTESELNFCATLENFNPDLTNKECTKQYYKNDSIDDFKTVVSVGGAKLSSPKNVCSVISKEADTKEKNVLKLETKISQLPKTDKNVEISASKTLVTPKSSLSSNMVNEVKKINSPFEISPSLLPKPNNVQKIIDLEEVSTDNDDFIENNLNNKLLQCEDSRDISDKRKTMKKIRSAKPIKCTSKYKMSLDALPSDYKKPSYKQSKLSKSFFHGKASFITKSTKMSTDKNIINNEQKNIPTIQLDEFQTSTPSDGSDSPSPIDIDATFIPENYRNEISALGTALVKRSTVEKSNLKNGGLFSDISFPSGLKSISKPGPSNAEEIFVEEFENSPIFEDDDSKENMNSFDRLPVEEEPNYKYKNDVVRKKAERRQLKGFDCKECEKYYSDLGLSTKEKNERMKKCSRHRAKFAPSNTPDNFWELDFPDTQECKARGYMDKTQKVKLNELCNL